MKRDTLNRILDIQDRALENEEYMCLSERFHILNEQLLILLSELPEEKQNVIWEYIEIGAAMHHKILELALKS